MPTNLEMAAAKFNHACNTLGLAYRAEVLTVWLDLGAQESGETIVIWDTTKPAASVTASYQVDFKARDLALEGKVDEAVEYCVNQCKAH